MKYKLFIFMLFATVGFTNPMGILSDQLQKLAFYAGVLGSMCLAFNSNVSLSGVDYPRKPYIVLMLSIVFSIFMASAFQMQSATVSLMATLPFLFSYGCFVILMKLNIPTEKIIRVYFVACAISIVVYFANLYTFPNVIFGGKEIGEDLSRGILRLPVLFIEVFVLLLFYSINKWLLDREKKWIWIIAVAGLMIILSVTRQIILYSVVLSLLFLLKNLSWVKKGLICLSVVAVAFFVLPQIPMFVEMMEFTESQAEENEEEDNIRIQAFEYYVDTKQTNTATRIFGNGMPSFGNSLWGQIFDSETEDLGVFAADVGWAGFYFYFGIFATFALLIMLVKAMLKKKREDQEYLTYWFAFIILNGIAAGPVVYYYQIFNIMVGLYLVYAPNENSTYNT